MYDVPATALRRRILRNDQDPSNWDLIKKFCRQELAGMDDVDEIFREYYMASVVRRRRT
jgi:hypothetical protein